MIYFFNAYEKLVLPGWIDGIGFFDGLGIEHMVNDFGRWLRQFTSIMKPMNYIAIAIEVLGHLALWFGIKSDRIRVTTVFLFISYHFITRLTFYVGLFPEIMYACWILLLPHSFWKNFTRINDPIDNRETLKAHLKTLPSM